MWGLPKRIMEHAEALPEATPLCPAALLHLGNRSAVDQALSRLARSGDLMRICQGVYMRPIETRFGLRGPCVGKALACLPPPLNLDNFDARFLTNCVEDKNMRGLSHRIMEHAEALPEAMPLCPVVLLHLGNPAAVDYALSRLTRLGHLMRTYQGVYMRPVENRFGKCAPRTGKALEALSAHWGRLSCRAAALRNRLRLTTQNPVREVYFTSGSNRRLDFGSSIAELRHAPRWQLAAPHRRRVRSSVPSHGSVPKRSRTVSKRFCRRSPRWSGKSLRSRALDSNCDLPWNPNRLEPPVPV